MWDCTADFIFALFSLFTRGIKVLWINGFFIELVILQAPSEKIFRLLRKWFFLFDLILKLTFERRVHR